MNEAHPEATPPDIYLVGLGLFELHHLTQQALEVLRRARTVLHLSSKHEKLLHVNPRAIDLTDLYGLPGRDWEVYSRIARHVVSVAAREHPIAFAVEGNPMAFNDICWEVARLGISEGFGVEAVPGLSATDILPIQLGFDVGDLGMQIVEATQLVIFKIELNPHLSTLVFQIAEFGTWNLPTGNGERRRRYALLAAHLLKFFPDEHPVIFIRSPTRAGETSKVHAIVLRDLESRAQEIPEGSTMYLPRVALPPMDDEVYAQLGFE